MAKRLGRGFDSLIPTELVEDEFDPTLDVDEQVSRLKELKINSIVPADDQPRRDFKADAIEALAASIKEHGVLQPIVVVKDGAKYKIVAGERRWRASKLAGEEKIPAIIRTLSDQKVLELSLIENVQREDLNAIEMATAYAKLKTQFNLSSEEVAKRVGKSESTIINTMRLLSLPEKVKKTMVEKGLSEGQMRPLIMADPKIIEAILPKIIAEGWSARRVEQYMVMLKAKKNNAVARISEYKEKENILSNKLGSKVKIRISNRGSGDLLIKFKDEKELEKICSILEK